MLLSLVLLVVGSLLLVFIMMLNKNYFDALEEFEEDLRAYSYPVKELFFIGIGILSLIDYQFQGIIMISKRREIAELNSDEDSAFSLYVLVVAQITYLYLGILATLFMTVLSEDLKVLFLGTSVAILAAYYPWYNIGFLVRKRREEILVDFNVVLSKLALLTNAGLTLRDAWFIVSYSEDKALYKELQITCIEMSNGTDEEIAFQNFAQRCSAEEIRKFISIIIQNRKKGSSDVANSLKRMAYDSMEVRKHEARRLGKNASQKMLTPILMIFLGILIMVIAPLLLN